MWQHLFASHYSPSKHFFQNNQVQVKDILHDHSKDNILPLDVAESSRDSFIQSLRAFRRAGFERLMGKELMNMVCRHFLFHRHGFTSHEPSAMSYGPSLAVGLRWACGRLAVGSRSGRCGSQNFPPSKNAEKMWFLGLIPAFLSPP